MSKRGSPDNVIDLVGGHREDSKPQSELEDARKKLKSTPSAKQASGADACNAISLLDDDEEGDKAFADFLSSNASSPFAAAPSAAATASANVKTEGGTPKSSNDGGGGKLGPTALLENQDDDIQIVDPILPTIHPEGGSAAGLAVSTNNDEDVQVVGTANETRLPHMRQHCTVHTFMTEERYDPSFKAANAKFCDLCFCYVCDKPASECSQWTRHCCATDSGPRAWVWKCERETVKRVSGSISSPATGDGPFPPDHETAQLNKTLTQCRRCSWFYRFDHRNFSVQIDRGPGCLDWCRACGRIASKKSFRRLQASPFMPSNTFDVFLGERVVPFRLHSHDPRLFDRFKERWETNAGNDQNWTYSEAEMDKDLFCHRFGPFPCLEMILASLPTCKLDEIPKTGTIRRRDEYYRGSEISADNTDVLLLENPSDRALLQELLNFGSIGFKDRNTDALLDGNIVANWNTAAQTGEFKLQVYLRSKAFVERVWYGERSAQMSKFFGIWFGIFPFPLVDLCRTRRATGASAPRSDSNSERMDDDRSSAESHSPDAPSTTEAEPTAINDEIVESKEKVDQFYKTAELNERNLSLVSGRSELLGGTCGSGETTLGSLLKSYARETLVEDVCNSSYSENARPLSAGDELVRWRYDSKPGVLLVSRPFKRTSFRCYVQDEDHDFIPLVRIDMLKMYNGCKTLASVMDHMENLHHASAPYVEGLTVDLLEFQRQSLQWALEREQTPGGVQSFLWSELPSLGQPGNTVYFNPILDRCRSSKPRLVRGGIIAEEMGLGKTVMSLALILENPAPQLPASGSPISSLSVAVNPPATNTNEGAVEWDSSLYARTSSSKIKRGSILSRGTLVVCHVSLVGQWIDEARSKLKDPGLVYPYHGHNRKRDAETLAKNSIVVTTYQTLASDVSYHAKKNGADYCAPCEQVRWWRVICDESHSLRDSNTRKSAAVMDLVADNKWLVSGTPVNTTFNDLKNQLKFIGLENVDELFRIFRRTAFHHTSDPSVPKRARMDYKEDVRRFGPFVFFLRNVMIRHTHQQKYRGTTTTLMSLPPRTERSVEIEFSQGEKQQYLTLENEARQSYLAFKRERGHELSKYFLRLSQKLTPLRIAASGGRIPLQDEKTEARDGEQNDDSDEETDTKKKYRKKVVHLSEFAYTSKFKALLTELTNIRDNDPDAKSLVFSQFTTTLEWLQQELPKHGFLFRTLSGDMTMKKRAKALHDFQNDPPTTIFLLSMRAGAVGINLTQANRVFLMEPSFNPALEAQAVGRVHRLGQKRDVEIIRLIMKDSVETRLVEMLKKKYGDASGHGGSDGDADEKKKSVPTSAAASLIGSIHTDRTTVLAAEFDLLFGIEGAGTTTSDVVAAMGTNEDLDPFDSFDL